MIIAILLLILTGILAGILAGLFGLGGGILFTPVLLFLFQYIGISDPVLWTIGTSLLCNFVAAVSSSFKHYQLDNMFLKEGLMTGLFGIAGTYAGSVFASSDYYNELEFTIFFSLILFYSVYHFLRKKPSDIETGRTVKALRWYHALLFGLAAGIVATLAGVGGGLILVPAMTIVLSFGFRKVVSISSLAIVLITLAGWLQYAMMRPESESFSGLGYGYVDLGMALPLIAGSIIGARYGVKLLTVIRLRTLEIAFGILVLFVIGRLIYGQI